MPKIKLSALVSDIKGKANGSVFARNKGGLYFRNNPSGGGQKTQKWAKARASFSSLAGKWRSLSPKNMNAWKSAVSNFPQVDAFGEPREQSGYELFMRLNQPLYNLGLPINEVPPMPEGTPNGGTMALLTYPNKLIVPDTAYAPYNCQVDEEVDIPPVPDKCVSDSTIYNPCWDMENLSDPLRLRVGLGIDSFVLSMLVDLHGVPNNTDGDPFLFPFFKASGAQQSFGFNIVINPSDEITFEFSYIQGEVSAKLFFRVPPYDRSKPFRCTFYFSDGDLSQSKLFFNDTVIPLSDDSTGSSWEEMKLLDFTFLQSNPQVVTPISLQHFVLSSGDHSLSQLELLHQGYHVPGLSFVTTFPFTKNGIFENEGADPSVGSLALPFMRPAHLSFPKKDWGITPKLFFFRENQPEVNSMVIVKTTPMQSAGRSGEQSGYKRLGVFDGILDNSFIEIGSHFSGTWGSIIDNSTIQSKVQFLNPSTGEVSAESKIIFAYLPEGFIASNIGDCDTANPCPENQRCISGTCVPFDFVESLQDVSANEAVKFKAGSDLASSVN